ncbi:hypothetical protein R1sor_011659 [Riccia sorocarpa]|uniref:Uncharacterized protein n=1 Tax=Riccia sorocarpa TaxID=122646 RepID=A0ABD3I1X3_9MARC
MADEPIEPIVTQAMPIVTQSIPRRRAKDLAEGPLGPDELVTIENVHRLVTHEMIWEVFPVMVAVGKNRDGTVNLREFKFEARRSHIRMMKYCTFAAMKATVPEGFSIYYADEYSRRGTAVDERGFEFTLGYVKLLYARAVLGRHMDWSRSSEPVIDAPESKTPRTQTLRTPRRVRPRLTVPGEINFGAIDRGSHALIVPHETEDLEARLKVEFEGRFQARLAEVAEGTRQAEEALWRANLAVADLTSSVATADVRIEELHAKIMQKDERIKDLLLVNNGQPTTIAALREDLDVEIADRAELIAELDDARGVAAGMDDEHELVAAQRKIIELRAEVAELKDQVKNTAEALEVERRPVRVYEERHRALETDIAERMRSVTPEELNPETQRATWELLQRYDASIQSLSGIATAAHQLVTKKYRNLRYDPVQLEGADLKMVVMRGNKAMWPPASRQA